MNEYYRSFNQLINKKEESVLKREIKKAKNSKRINIEIPYSLDLKIDAILIKLKKENHNATKKDAIVQIMQKGCKEWNNQ
tara:strand:+ start:56 stop:295 length:240 start_codon:yes stop_codon:yes gene_type:complete